jgi:hypothetical protein
MKKVWEKPKLIVLYRGRPEESVLQACKGDTGLTSGPGQPRKCFQKIKGATYPCSAIVRT